eukprot:TRINITY_DN19514_c0_g1_i1.p1 TRINITY_DN19514_c0_g1~~TRINITY_DN19514_c0_g1_i1.p1  ORF type:complete len:212 (-),score=21.22 TRINITY_DN19514_c0_g1_i1:517-1152(-)
MDWSNVGTEELFEALKEVEWSAAPRPLSEFFQRFTSPKNYSKWTGRLKCNFYYYRTNYFALLILVLTLAFLRNPSALVAVFLTALSLACMNDSFALALSDRLTRGVRRLSPPLAAKMRAPVTRTSTTRGRPLKGAVHIGGQDRRVVVVLLFAGSILVGYLTAGALTALGSLLLAFLLIVLHATFRSPNLKARLNTFREDFRAQWRGYSDAP